MMLRMPPHQSSQQARNTDAKTSVQLVSHASASEAVSHPMEVDLAAEDHLVGQLHEEDGEALLRAIFSAGGNHECSGLHQAIQAAAHRLKVSSVERAQVPLQRVQIPRDVFRLVTLASHHIRQRLQRFQD